MRKLATIIIVVLFIATLRPSAEQASACDQEHTAWIDEVMREIETIKPGMTRADVLKVFEEDGGLSTVRQRSYLYSRCKNIKVTFYFEPVEKPDSEGRIWHESAADKIVKMSRPFLESPAMD